MINLQGNLYDIIAIGRNFDLLHGKSTDYVYKRTKSSCTIYKKADGKSLTYIEFKGAVKKLRQGEQNEQKNII